MSFDFVKRENEFFCCLLSRLRKETYFHDDVLNADTMKRRMPMKIKNENEWEENRRQVTSPRRTLRYKSKHTYKIQYNLVCHLKHTQTTTKTIERNTLSLGINRRCLWSKEKLHWLSKIYWKIFFFYSTLFMWNKIRHVFCQKGKINELFFLCAIDRLRSHLSTWMKRKQTTRLSQ